MFELARSLRRSQSPLPAWLFPAACQAPQLFRLRRGTSSKPVSQLPEPEFLDYLKNMDFGPAETLITHSALRKIFLPTVRADLEMGENYVYTTEEPFDCPITAFGGTRDPLVTLPELEAWKEQTHSEFRFVRLDRKHDFLESDRDLLIGEILRDLSSLLD